MDARYRARAARLPALRWEHPGLARVAAWRRAGRAPESAIATARDALAGRFTFLGRSEDLGCDVDWFHPDLDRGTRLWKTLLHEFGFAEDLARTFADTGEARYRERLFALARSWRAAAPIGCPGFSLDAWNARAVATRLIHWAVAGAELGLRPGDPDADWLGREIGLHGLFLRDNLELDVRGNHLFRDAVGLVFAQELVGAAPDALAFLQSQVREQVLPDGCHIERAPLYHALCARDLLEVRLLLGPSAPGWLEDALARMAGFLQAMALGDGEIPLLGDGWLGEVSTPRLVAAARQIAEPVVPRAPERASGLVPLRAGPWRLVARAGPHAPDEQMGHAHGDLLSFDASFGRQRVVTDTGTLLYDPGPERQRIRSTAAHNTIRVDGVEQLEAWGSFRVARRGRARAASRGRAETGSGTWEWLAASHDAYAHLAGRPFHHRLWAVGPPGLLVLDAVLGTGSHQIESFLHIHPDSEASVLRIKTLAAEATVEPAPLHQRFGETRDMRRHAVTLRSDLPWAGGWWIAPAGAPAPETAFSFGESALRVRLPGVSLALSWRPQATDAQEIVSFCSVSGGSAT